MTIGNTYYCMLKLRTAVTLEMINYLSLMSDIAQPHSFNVCIIVLYAI